MRHTGPALGPAIVIALGFSLSAAACGPKAVEPARPAPHEVPPVAVATPGGAEPTAAEPAAATHPRGDLCDVLAAVVAAGQDHFASMRVPDPAEDGSDMGIWTANLWPMNADYASTTFVMGSGGWYASWKSAAPEAATKALHGEVSACAVTRTMTVEPAQYVPNPNYTSPFDSIAVEASKDVRYKWSVKGTKTRVDLEILIDEDGTKVRLNAFDL